MMPTVETLLECLPPDRNEWMTVKDKQNVYDIIEEILDAHKNFAPYYDNIALYFDGDSTEEICKNIYNFLKRNIRYHEETEDNQTTALPTGILSRRMGDCKHYSSFAGGVLDALNRLNGTNRKWSYRFASYDLFNPAPHHVFVVANDDDRQEEIWIDPTPGAKNQIPVWLIDKKINIKPMALRRQIAGLNVGAIQQIEYVEELPVVETQELAPEVMQPVYEAAAESEPTPEIQNAIEVLLNYGVMNEAGEVSDSKLLELSKTLPYNEFELVSQARQTLQLAIADAVSQAAEIAENTGISYNDAIGSFFSDLWRGVKKVTLAAPRNAYLSLVAINAFGMATKLYNAIYKDDGTFWQPGQDKLYKKWNSFGGDWHNLNNAIKSGHKKKAILGCVDCDEDEPGTMGVAPAIPAWVAIAGALIAAITPLVKEILSARRQQGMMNLNVDPTTGLPVGMNMPSGTPGDYSTGSITDWIKSHPLESAGIGIGAYYLFTQVGKKASGVNVSNKGLVYVLAGTGLLVAYKLATKTPVVVGSNSIGIIYDTDVANWDVPGTEWYVPKPADISCDAVDSYIALLNDYIKQWNKRLADAQGALIKNRTKINNAQTMVNNLNQRLGEYNVKKDICLNPPPAPVEETVTDNTGGSSSTGSGKTGLLLLAAGVAAVVIYKNKNRRRNRKASAK